MIRGFREYWLWRYLRTAWKASREAVGIKSILYHRLNLPVEKGYDYTQGSKNVLINIDASYEAIAARMPDIRAELLRDVTLRRRSNGKAVLVIALNTIYVSKL